MNASEHTMSSTSPCVVGEGTGASYAGGAIAASPPLLLRSPPPLVSSSVHSSRRVTSRSPMLLQLSPSVATSPLKKSAFDVGGIREAAASAAVAFLTSPRSHPCMRSGRMPPPPPHRAQQMLSGPLQLLSTAKCHKTGEHGGSGSGSGGGWRLRGRCRSMPEMVTKLVVCEGFLDIAAVCAAARVSCRWKSLAYRPSSFGVDLDFSPFRHRLTAQVFDELIKARRIRLSRNNKRLRTVNLWNCCAISFRKSAELVSKCSGLKELRILHNKQRSCAHCVQEHHTTFFSDFSYLMNRCENLWVRSSTEIFWLGRGEEFVNSTVAHVQKWFADYLSVECAADNACLARIVQLVNEFGRTVCQGRPMQSGLLFMLTSLRNHSFAQHGELEVLASDEQWIHDGEQIELAYMKFAVRGCTPPAAPPSAHPNAHSEPHATAAGNSTPPILYSPPGQLGGGSGINTATAAASQLQQLQHMQLVAQAHASLQAQSHLYQGADGDGGAALEDVATLSNEIRSVVAEELMHVSSQQQQPQGSHGTGTPPPPQAAASFSPPPSQVHFDALASVPPPTAPPLTLQISPRVCNAPNHVLFIGAPYRWPQPRALAADDAMED